MHAITGENGAGKSTLMKLLAGVHQPDAGELFIDGKLRHLHSPAAARHAGISTVFQELTVLPNLSVAENLLLGREPTRFGWLNRSAMQDEARAVLARIGIELDPQRACGSLSIGEQQLVEIAKGVSTDASVFIFDEPTAPLNRAEVDKLEALIGALKAQGKLVFYISHRLDEIFRLCDTVTVLKDGQWVATEPISALTHDSLITLMVGRPLQALFPPRASAAPGAAALDVRRLTPLAGGATARLQLRRGEIVGLGGLEGPGPARDRARVGRCDSAQRKRDRSQHSRWRHHALRPARRSRADRAPGCRVDSRRPQARRPVPRAADRRQHRPGAVARASG